MKQLDHKVALVTGASRGIGKAIAQGFADAGASVCCSGRTEAQIMATAAAIRESGGEALHVPCDVNDLRSVENLFKAAKQQFGGVDIVVVNAAIQPGNKTIEDSDPDDWKSTIDTNLMGAYYTMRTAIPYLKERGAGKMIVIGSGVGHRAMPNCSAYAASKAALWMMVRVLAQEVASFNISVNELIPGLVDTDMFRASAPTANIAQIRQVEWLKQPEDVLPMALFIASQPAMGPTSQSYSPARREL